MIGIGRLYCYALAAAGEAGVTRMLELLETEPHEVLGLLGVTAFDQLGPSHVPPGGASGAAGDAQPVPADESFGYPLSLIELHKP